MKHPATLRETLEHQPVELEFGTSGLRGLVRDITDLEAYVATRAFLQFVVDSGGACPSGTVYVAGDLRPSTAEIFLPVCRAVADAGFSAVALGRIPSPALLAYAMKRRAPSIMITGSHIPFDRNGIKLNRASGELRKTDEEPIREAQRRLRAAEHDTPASQSMFDSNGALRAVFRSPPPEAIAGAAAEYERRYTEAFPRGPLVGKRILVYQHSAVGRDLLVDVLGRLGAVAMPAGRSESFVPVDTEAVNEEMLQAIQQLVDASGGSDIDAVVSTDGDGDRPLVLGVDAGKVRFFPGDLLGIVTADFVGARHIAVPISVNDAVDAYFEPRGITPVKTRIGSPYVIDAMRQVGWEANGGFLTAAQLSIPGGGVIEALPTRDALLPILAALYASVGFGIPLTDLLSRLPRRFGKSSLLREFPREKARAVVQRFSLPDASVVEARREKAHGAQWITERLDGTRAALDAEGPVCAALETVSREAARWFTAQDGFSGVRWINWLDGVRIGFDNGDIVHVRPSGNAPELRLYANAATSERTEEIARKGTAPGGILRRLEAEVDERQAIEAFRATPGILRLECPVQNYAWGGFDFIPSLLGETNPGRIPSAEMWIGAHPASPSSALVDERKIRLDRLVEAAATRALGARDAARFGGRLPFLMKVLDARVMLSIQAHPTREQAAAGFARENAAGIPIDSPRRMYRDRDHKPEVHVTLTDFWMLHGFRPLNEIEAVLAAEPELGRIMPDFSDRLRAAGSRQPARAHLLRDLYSIIMSAPQDRITEVLSPLIERLSRQSGTFDRDAPGFWALRAVRDLPLPDGHVDRGIFSIYLLNLLHLKPGQGTYQPAGTLHAYLEGTNVELMANSDNVLRGGLTPKGIDTGELLRIVAFFDGRPRILSGREAPDGVRAYETPAEEFLLERLELMADARPLAARAGSAQTLMVIEGEARCVSKGKALPMRRGTAWFVPAGIRYELGAGPRGALVFRARVPG